MMLNPFAINRILIVFAFIWLGCLTWYVRVQPNWKYEYCEIRDIMDAQAVKIVDLQIQRDMMQRLAESFKMQVDTMEIPEEYPDWQKYKIGTTLDTEGGE